MVGDIRGHRAAADLQQRAHARATAERRRRGGPDSRVTRYLDALPALPDPRRSHGGREDTAGIEGAQGGLPAQEECPMLRSAHHHSDSLYYSLGSHFQGSS